MKILYKKTSTGATQVWSQEIQGHKYRTISGQIDGKKTTSEWTVCQPTNVGRANERNPTEQAKFEVAANYKKKLDVDYHENQKKINEVKMFKPMLANKFEDYRTKINLSDGWYSQPKLDGMRCIATKDGLWSRGGKPIYGVPHIIEALAPFFAEHPDLIFDGELYNHDYKDDFNTIISCVKKQTPTPEEEQKSRDIIQYHIYDVPSYVSSFARRDTVLENFEYRIAPQHRPKSPIQFVYTTLIESQKHMDEMNSALISDGYEGQILRNGNSPYQNKRCNDLLKRKEFIDEEYPLVDLTEGIGNWSGYAKTATLRLPDGRTFGAGVKGNQEFTRQLLKDKSQYIGKPTTIRYFNLTPDGIPRFPIAKEFNRDDI